MLSVETLRAQLGLIPHPIEGGAMHRLASDEVFHFYLGDPVEMLQLGPDGSHRVVAIGTDLAAGERPQVVVPRGVWPGARLRAGGFGYADYETAARATLLHTHPAAAPLIAALTRP
jgi:hypothetical protein